MTAKDYPISGFTTTVHPGRISNLFAQCEQFFSGIVSFVCVISAISAFIQHDMVTGIQGLVIGSLLSPYGLQKLVYMSCSLE